MSAGLVLAEIRALGRIVTLRPDGKLSIKPAIPDGADRIRAHRAEIVELLKREAPPSAAVQVPLRPFCEVLRTIPIWDGLTEAEKEGELRAWCRRTQTIGFKVCVSP